MINKKLEDRLLKYGNQYSDIIKLLEKCESKTVGEIRIGNKEKITVNPILDRMILTYLKKLKIKVVYLDADEGAEKVALCPNEVHRVLTGDIKKSSKIKIFNKRKNPMFKIDMASFVICNECGAIEEIK